MIRSCLDLSIIVLVSGFMVILALTGVSGTFPITLVSAPFVLIVPGYALAAALFPGDEIGLAERAMLVLAGSLAVSALGGLMLHWLPVLLTTSSWAFLLASLSVLFSIIALFRRLDLGEWRGVDLGEKYRLSLFQYSLVVVALIVAISAMTFAYRNASEQAMAEFTQLWIIPVQGSTNSAVEVGVSNEYANTVAYQLQLLADGQRFQSFTIEIEPEEQWVTQVTPPLGSDQRIEALLYQQDSPDSIHRRVALVVGDE